MSSRSRPFPVWAALTLVVGLAGVGCSTPTPDSSTSRIAVFAAASLRDAMELAIEAYAEVAPDVTIELSTGSSAALRTQIEQGAPADLLLAADEREPERLVRAGLADGVAVPFAANSVVVVVPVDNPAGIDSPADLARPGIKVIAAGEAVPISTYAGRLVDLLAAVAGYPPDFADAYASNIVSREENVSAVLAKLELGEGDAGIVYRTDALHSDQVKVIGLPADIMVPAIYSGVVVGHTERATAAAGFLHWLAGRSGQAILRSQGFLAPPR
jgi:molybdate transport system substrate-binding protein